MEVLHTVLTIVQIICAVLLVFIVTIQSGKSEGLGGIIGGSAETFLSKNGSSSLDAKLTKATKWVAAVFIVLTLALNLI